ncbi:MAG: IS3 family transposase [Gemmataceae bacterium]|nr:IS3 family transposase [Gemmataceae bacterium]
MARPRATYTAEFKLSAVKMITDQKLAVAEVARRLDVGENLLRQWKKAFLDRGDAAFPGHGSPAPADDEVGRLRAEVTRLKAERDPAKKSRRLLRQPPDLTFRFIAANAGEWPVRWMCAALDVSASGYYAWASRPDSPAEQRRQGLADAIAAVHADIRGRYGSPRMAAELNARGHPCSENTVAKLMRAHGVRAAAPRRFVGTTDSRHRLPVAENLLARDFGPAGPNEAWSADITYIPTRDGWLYLAVVEDLFSRRIVGWSMAAAMESRLVVDALEMAVVSRRPGAGLVAHSDRGSQYASDHYQRVLAAAGAVCSMSRVAQCWDNAPVESFFGTLKRELGVEVFADRGQARAAIFEYLEVFYNRARRHSSLGYVSPDEFERAHNQAHR